MAPVSWPQIIPLEKNPLKAVYWCDSTADEAELPPVSSHGRQKLLTSADQATLGAEEYICNLKTAGTKSFSPLVVDF